MSVASDGKHCVVDAGLKALSFDSGAPTIRDGDEFEYMSGGDEHGILKRKDGENVHWKVGDLVWLIPGHVDPTVNLYDEFFFVDEQEEFVEKVADIQGRGPGR